ncbi:MAG: carbohydrate kinase family protein [Pseudomonadota bacterium]|nr:carbohydrate kinase family protein [Pseudomonadota bacterium]
MKAVICGSFAYDNIMVFGDRFGNHILPDKINMLNVSFLVPHLRKEFGGCAGNIAYNFKKIGGNPLAVGTVGEDFVPYRNWLDKLGIVRDFVTEVPTTYTAQAFITTDTDNNQITAFHPGAMEFSTVNDLSSIEEAEIGIISPDGKEGMLAHAKQMSEKSIPFVFDPGQGMPMFDGRELQDFIELADWVSVNEYEAEVMEQRTGLDSAAIAKRVKAYIVTRGARGSSIHSEHGELEIPSVTVDKVRDPTGCGDAYRAGILYGLGNGFDLLQTGRLSSILGAIKVSSKGTQNHELTRELVEKIFVESFGEPLDW